MSTRFLHTFANQLSGRILDHDTLMWISDTVDYDDLDKVLNHGVRPKFIVNDNCFSNAERDFLCLPVFLEKQAIAFRGVAVNDDIQCQDCFNFCINKKQTNRHLVLKLVEYFGLKTSHYTWSGVDQSHDMSRIIDEIQKLRDQEKCLGMTDQSVDAFLSEILSECKIQPKFIHHLKEKFTDSSVVNYGGNLWTWSHGLNDIFQSTAVSLIAESIQFQKVSCVTEKTGYAILGLTFPIWIGGYATADAWRRAGFDIFDDIIDHSYQYRSTLIERCYYAFYDNLEILDNLNLAQAKRQECFKRLVNNRNLLLEGQLTKYCYQEIERWPIEIQQIGRSTMTWLYADLSHQVRNQFDQNR